MTNNIKNSKTSAEQTVEKAAAQLIELADTLHANPETAWQEYQAVDWVTGVLADQGFIVTRKYLGFDTAFLEE